MVGFGLVLTLASGRNLRNFTACYRLFSERKRSYLRPSEIGTCRVGALPRLVGGAESLLAHVHVPSWEISVVEEERESVRNQTHLL